MEVISAIVTALALGAAAGLKETVPQAVKDGYAALKALLKRKAPAAVPSVEQLEQAPDSKARRAVVEEDLGKVGAATVGELLVQAQELLTSIEELAPQTAEVIGVSLKDIKGASLVIRDVLSAGGGVKIDQAEIAGDITIEGIRAGEGTPDPNG